ncbi:MAG: antitoxin VapB family protein [Thermoplasmata archaeon]
MSTKNIALREEVYKKLKEAKRPDESFSDIINELLEHKGSLLPLWGSLSGYKTLEVIEKDVNAIRSGARVRT